jgi:hypothetical protein
MEARARSNGKIGGSRSKLDKHLFDRNAALFVRRYVELKEFVLLLRAQLRHEAHNDQRTPRQCHSRFRWLRSMPPV